MDMPTPRAAAKMQARRNQVQPPSSIQDSSDEVAMMEELQAEVRTQEVRIRQLREEILALEELQTQQELENEMKKVSVTNPTVGDVATPACSPLAKTNNLVEAARGMMDVAAGRRDRNTLTSANRREEEEDSFMMGSP